MRDFAAFGALAGGDHHIHGHGVCDRVRDAALELSVVAILLQFAVGLVFGLGLLLSGMSNPAKVLNFLDLGGMASGSWDPSLAFVMAGAVAVALVGFRFVLRRPRPLFGERFHLPTSRELDFRIVSGPAIFGIGWGLAGFCPGPAFTALGYGSRAAFIFITAMFAGMWLARFVERLPSVSRIANPADPLET
jgi:uncharacterized membrane protein YedE/YeeE